MTFAPATIISPIVNANCIHNHNPNPNLNLFPTLNQKQIITFTLTLCCWKYHHRSNCRRSKCRITIGVIQNIPYTYIDQYSMNAAAIYSVLIYEYFVVVFPIDLYCKLLCFVLIKIEYINYIKKKHV